MSKKLLPPTNFRVVITPRGGYWYGQEPERSSRQLQQEAYGIARQVKRHVDDWDDVRVEFDRPAVCEHCGYPWTEANPDFNGGCCESDMAAHDMRNAK